MSASLDALAARLVAGYARIGVNGSEEPLPDRESIHRLCQQLLGLLFPGFFSAEQVPRAQREARTLAGLAEMRALMREQILRARRLEARQCGAAVPATLGTEVDQAVHELLDELVTVRELVETDLDAAFRNDPSARDRETILLSYPSIEAMAVQRFAHRLYRRAIPVVPRMMTEVVHRATGIDIHPGAAIDEHFFIDHGTGVVIGETCRIGKHCVLYQGVSLVAFNPLARNQAGVLVRGQENKRHPDLEDHVTVYAGATILGGTTTIGHHSVIGGSVWLTHSVAPFSRVRMKEPELEITKRQPRAPPAGSASQEGREGGQG